MPEPPRLRAGDSYACPRCRRPHIVEQPYADRTTAEQRHLYVTCRGDQYFVGIAPREDLKDDDGVDVA